MNWLVKTDEGKALTNVHQQGPEWTVTVPTSWSGRMIFVMPYMKSATRQVSVKTTVEALPAETVATGGLQVRIVQEGRRYYASINVVRPCPFS